jgi:tetratricopeptide (TPR) repeat protein
LARQYALASARRAFTEGVLYPPHFSHYAHHFSNWSASALKNLDLEDELRKLAEEAAASENPHRVTAAAGFYGGRGDTEKAIRLYQKAYEMPGSDRRNLAYYLYQHYYQRKTKTDLEKALEMLETMRKTGNPNFSGYHQEWNYLQSKVSLLYQLDKKDEARALVRECFGKTAFSRQGYWSYSQLATHAQNAKDWALAAEVYEQMIRIMRRQPGVSQDWSTLSNFYLSCANAYAEAGEAQKAVDSLLRGLSLIPREQSQWYQQIVQETLRRSLKGKSLDAVVAEHEKQVAATGAEKPHLRLVFAEAYRQAGKTREMLRQQRIAANLMLKDVPLRRQIVDAYLGLGEKESAIEALLEWARFDAQNLEIYQRLGDLYQQMGKAEQAILAWATMAEVRPREAEGYRAYAKKLCDIKLLDEAAVAFRKAVKYRPTEFAIAEELSQVYSGLNQQDRIPALWTDGESACRKAIEDFKDDPTPWLSLGRFLVKQNRRQEARKLYEEICRRHWPRFHSETVNEASQQLHKL